jgi:VWA domain-containing protein/aerotolerance regulator-like protein
VTLLVPIALTALAVPVLIYVIHWLFGARRRVRVPAIFLWAELPQARTGRSRRRIPPFTWLLLLQLLAASLAAVALARPVGPYEAPRHLALVFDASASMQATDVSPTRFEAARARALDRLNALGPQDLVTVIRAGREATLIATGTADNVRSAVVGLQPGRTAPAIREGLALASTEVAASPERSERRGQIVLLTDGAWPPPEAIGPLAAPVEVVAVGGGSENQAISSVVVRMDPTGRGQTAFVEVANHAEHAARAPLRVLADGAPLDERQVDIAPRTRARVSIPLPVDAHRVSVRLLGHDALALDDVQDTIAPGGPPREVDLLGRVSDGLRRAIESVPSLHVRTADAPLQPDLTVLAGVLPPKLPAGPLLLIDPPANSARLLGVGLGSGARVQPSHPLLLGLDLAALQDESPSVSGVPGWAHVVLGTLQGPLIMEGRLDGHPVVVMTFDPAVSGLEKSLAFPLLVSNATSFLLTRSEVGAIEGAEAFDPAESDIAPRPIPTFQSIAPVTEASSGAKDLWPWFLTACLVVLGAEWLVFARRG